MNKTRSYYTTIREDLIDLVEGSQLKVLEIGCGTGGTLMTLKSKGFASKITGIEIEKEIANHAKKNGVTEIINDDFGIAARKMIAKKRKFDLLIFGDVLEHLIDPWEAMELAARLLIKGGQIIISIPNIRHYSILKKIIIKGSFEYEEDGLLDRTHLRFFCKSDIVKLVNKEFSITKIQTQPIALSFRGKLFRLLTMNLFNNFLTTQYLISATKVKD